MNTTQRLRDLSEVELRAVKVAFYLAQGMSETEIAGLLFPNEAPETARPRVSNAKKLALRKGWLRRPTLGKSFPQEDNMALREEAHHHDWRDLEEELHEQSGKVLKSLRVFYSGGNEEPKNKDEWDDEIELFAQNAAPYVLEHMCKSRTGIAVGWGTTVACAIEALDKCLGELRRLKQNGQKKTQIVPTACDPLKPPKGRDTSSTSLAALLSDYLNGPRSGRVLSLENVPSVLPEIYIDDAKRKSLEQDFLKYCRDYWEILGDQEDPSSNSWANRVDTIISSGGSFHQWQIFADALLHNSGIVKDDLTKLAVGDIGGVLIPRSGLSVKDTARFEQIRKLWTGIRLEKYQRIARNAAQCNDPDGPAGSVLVAIGKGKAEIILDLVTRDDTRVVNSLLIDVYLARAIRRLLAQRKHNQSSSQLRK